jgi:hypothetical protein
MRSEGIGGIALNKQKAKWGPLCPACQDDYIPNFHKIEVEKPSKLDMLP